MGIRDSIVTGSLLEFAIEQIARMPVGRVEFAELHPLNFQEYLSGMGNQASVSYTHLDVYKRQL